MSEIRFYHLERQSLEEVLPALLAKAYENGHKIIVKTSNEKHVQHLNDLLWTYNPNSFLPHGCEKTGQAADQPIWITDKDENPNGADVLILTHGTHSETVNDFALCCEVFDGRDDIMLSSARARWKSYKDEETEHSLTYWQQGQNGWEKKATG